MELQMVELHISQASKFSNYKTSYVSFADQLLVAKFLVVLDVPKGLSPPCLQKISANIYCVSYLAR